MFDSQRSILSTVSEAYMLNDIEISGLKGAMDVSLDAFYHRLLTHSTCLLPQLWLDNQAAMEETLSSTVARVTSAVTGFSNRFIGQTKSQARLNAIASYDQSNELFKVRIHFTNNRFLFSSQVVPRLS